MSLIFWQQGYFAESSKIQSHCGSLRSSNLLKIVQLHDTFHTIFEYNGSFFVRVTDLNVWTRRTRPIHNPK